jgi:rhamnulose-1-phosphate aldolase
MTFVHDLDERLFTRSLWKMCTEAIVVFPDGVSIVPWMLCGTKEIGQSTANNMRKSRIVIWALHGVFAVGETIDDAYGLIETVEKAAQIYMLTKNHPLINEISDDNLRELAEYFNANVRENYLD